MADPTPTPPSPAERFAGLVLDDHCIDHGDVDGDLIQDWAVECGLLAPVPVSQPCADGIERECRCADYGEWPTTCYRLTDAGRAAIAAAQAGQ